MLRSEEAKSPLQGAGDSRRHLEEMMGDFHLRIPEETAVALRLTPEAAAVEIRLIAAVKLYEMGKLSADTASTLAGIPRTVFLTKLADYGVPTFKMTEEELREDLARA